MIGFGMLEDPADPQLSFMVMMGGILISVLYTMTLRRKAEFKGLCGRREGVRRLLTIYYELLLALILVYIMGYKLFTKAWWLYLWQLDVWRSVDTSSPRLRSVMG